MKLTFKYAESTDFKSLKSYDIITANFEIPDAAQHLIGYEQRIEKITEIVAQLSDAVIFFTCNELDMKNQLISPGRVEEGRQALFLKFHMAVLQFDTIRVRRSSRQLKIYLPVEPANPGAYTHRDRKKKSIRYYLRQPATARYNDEWEKAYQAKIQALSDQLLILLNADPSDDWHFMGYHPWWKDRRASTRFNNRVKAQMKDEKQRRKREGKAKLKGQKPHPQTGAGRRPGAIPGEFMGVQFRSQLEIRFAAELASRDIKWIYELERLGKGNYLVDFYLPDLKTWVEVKGRFEPRDDYLLREVADYLLSERNERLFVYTSGKPFVVKDGGFEKISRDDFWQMIMSGNE